MSYMVFKSFIYKIFIYKDLKHRKDSVLCLLFQLSSLLIECLILSIVEREDSYGYEISQTVKLVANIKESTLYPILRKLEQNGYLHTYSQEFQGRNRKYYSITDSGKEQLIFLKKEWNEYYHTIDDIIEGRMIPDGK